MKNKRGFGRIVALMAVMVMAVTLFAGSFSLQVQADANGKVTATSANVRKEADKNSDAVGGLLKNDTFVVKGQTTGADGKIWYLIVFGNGKEGYVRSDLVSVDGEVGTVGNTTTTTPSVQTSGVTKLNPVSGSVTGKTVNIRAGAGADTDKVSSVNKGDVLTIIGQATGSDDKVWYQVTFISNNKEVTGFIRSDYVDPAGSLTPYKEPVTEPEPSTPPTTEPDEPVVQEPEQQEPVVEEKNVQLESQENVVVEDKRTEEKQVETKPREQSSADKVLSVMMGAKQKETTSKTRNTTTKREVVVNKPKREKKSVGGFMNDSLGIVDNAEKNETKKTAKTTVKKSTTEDGK